MTRLTWNTAGTRIYEAGVDHGVLYVPGGASTPSAVIPAVVQSASAGPGTNASYTAILPSAPTVGNMLVVIAGSSQFNNVASALTPAGFTSQADSGVTSAGDDRDRVQIFTKMVAAGDTASVTVTFTTNASFDTNTLVVMEVSGVDSVLGVAAGASISGASPSIAAGANNLVVTAVSQNSGSTFVPSSPFTLVKRVPSSFHEMDVASTVTVSAGTLTPTWTSMGTPARAASIALYAASAPIDNTFTGVEWPGLISVEENPSGGDVTGYYIDGFKYLNVAASTEFEATITAYYSPPQFDACDGISSLNGLLMMDQPRKPFGLSYRTLLGNELSSSYGYRLHIVYNAMVSPSSRSHNTLTDSAEAGNMSWKITTEPVALTGRKPTSHIVIDSTRTAAADLTAVQDILYGTASTAPRMPTTAELLTLFA